MKRIILASIIILAIAFASAQTARDKIDLNGIWEFEQTKTAFAPLKFTRKIPVPGIISMAIPKIEQYKLLFAQARKDGKVKAEQRPKYEPRYNWYRRFVFVPKELSGKEAVLSLLKSQYVTQIYVNGMDLGTFINCYTPVDIVVTSALRYGQMNEILIKLGDHQWLPSAVPGGLDDAKVSFISGIWDDVELTFTGNFRVHRALVLPSLKRSCALVKLQIQNLYPVRNGYGFALLDSLNIKVVIKEKTTGTEVGSEIVFVKIRGDMITHYELNVKISSPHAWTPDNPFLYIAEVSLEDSGKICDRVEKQFGMRDFERTGKYFSLNGQRILLRGTNICLHRFMDDPQCNDLPWNKEWVSKLMVEIPKKLNWNFMRNHVGILPHFWYDIADENGIMLQNEWFLWQAHGSNEETRKEYTDWVWADGSHPSIAIWDAMNELKNEYIGNVLIPELKQLDPTRIWDNGYMEATDLMVTDDMDESHTYNNQAWRPDYKEWLDKNPLPIGDLNYWGDYPQKMDNFSSAQIVNEYGWIWLWRNGKPDPLSYNVFEYYLGGFEDINANREFQAYSLQWETELFRVHRSVAGLLCFNYLTGNFGFTGDYFINDIKELTPGPALLWYKHCFSPVAAFIDLVDYRYTKHVKPLEKSSTLNFNIIGVNDLPINAKGMVKVYLLNSDGQKIVEVIDSITIPAYLTQPLPLSVKLPKETGGYLLMSEFFNLSDASLKPVISRRYIKVGESNEYKFFEIKPENL